MNTSPSEQLRYFRQQQATMLDTIEQLVTIESPSDVKAAVDRLGTVLASRFGELGGKVKLYPAEKFGNHLQVDFRGHQLPRFPRHQLPHFSQKTREMGHPGSDPGSDPGSGDPEIGRLRKPILLLGHMDTVYPIGTISKMPFRVAKGRAWGPGVFDMKSGIALALHAIEALLLWNEGKLPRPVTVLLVSDEEVGSTSSRPITERLARESKAVLVVEPAAGPRGALKTSRKGVGEYTLRVTGVAAHAGADFEKGHSAVVELSRQILRLSELVEVKRGTTINVGKVSGGTRTNVVPSEARAVIDVRVTTRKDAEKLHRQLLALRPFNPQCKSTVAGGVNRPPMERTAQIVGLYRKAAQIATELGWRLDEAAVGGGSDGNFTAALGIPTLDGLGAVGEGAHAAHESVIVSELPKRAALLAGLIASL